MVYTPKMFIPKKKTRFLRQTVFLFFFILLEIFLGKGLNWQTGDNRHESWNLQGDSKFGFSFDILKFLVSGH